MLKTRVLSYKIIESWSFSGCYKLLQIVTHDQTVADGRAGGPTKDAQPWNEDSAQKRVGASAAPNAATAKDLPKLPNQVTPSPTVVTGP